MKRYGQFKYLICPFLKPATTTAWQRGEIVAFNVHWYDISQTPFFFMHWGLWDQWGLNFFPIHIRMLIRIMYDEVHFHQLLANPCSFASCEVFFSFIFLVEKWFVLLSSYLRFRFLAIHQMNSSYLCLTFFQKSENISNEVCQSGQNKFVLLVLGVVVKIS